MIQLKIEREAMKKETDEASPEAPAAHRGRAGQRRAQLPPTWKRSGRPKASAQGSEQILGFGDPHQIEDRGDYNRVAELQYGKLPSWRSA